MVFRNIISLRLNSKPVFSQIHHQGVVLDGDTFFSASISYATSKHEITICEIKKANVKPLDNDEIQVARKDVSFIGAGLASNLILARQIELQKIKKKDVDAVLKFQIEPLLPYPISDCLLESMKINEDAEIDKYLVFSCLKDDLKTYIEKLNQFGIDPDGIYSKSLALLQFANLFFQDLSPKIFIDIGYKETTCILISNKKLIAARSLPIGLDQELNKEEDDSYLKILVRELQRVLVSFQNVKSFDSNPPICFTGAGERDQFILELLGKYLGVSLINIEKLPEDVSLTNKISIQECLSYAIPIGLALFQSPRQAEKQALNFRKEEFVYSGLWSRWKKELLTYFALSASISIILFLAGQNVIKKGDNVLRERYRDLCSVLEKSPDEGEFTAKEIEDRLFTIKGKHWPVSDEIPLHPNLPRVSDVLAWLSTHPKIRLNNQEGGQDSLKLENFYYTMVKRPEKGRFKEPYQVRCDLEFTASSPTQAREFHEALNTPNSFVDPKMEVKWTVHKGKYQASFYLKDRTHYPQGG